jgi:hypothetical protein
VPSDLIKFRQRLRNRAQALGLVARRDRRTGSWSVTGRYGIMAEGLDDEAFAELIGRLSLQRNLAEGRILPVAGDGVN